MSLGRVMTAYGLPAVERCVAVCKERLPKARDQPTDSKKYVIIAPLDSFKTLSCTIRTPWSPLEARQYSQEGKTLSYRADASTAACLKSHVLIAFCRLFLLFQVRRSVQRHHIWCGQAPPRQ